jgi:hypothetical protein
MSFTILTILFTLLAGIAGSRLANHYSVYALVPVTFFFLALAAAGCMACGATLFGSALAALSGVTGLQFGYLLRLFVPRRGCRQGAVLCPPVRSAHITAVDRNADMALTARMPGGSFRTSFSAQPIKPRPIRLCPASNRADVQNSIPRLAR